MKQLLLLILSIGLISSAQAQDKIQKMPKFQAGISLAPLANSLTSIGYKTGVAINVAADLKKINDNFTLFGETGIVLFSGKGNDGSYKRPNGTLIPILAGVNYTSNNLKIGGGVGYSSFNTGDSEAGTVSGLTFSPRVSYSIGNFDVQFKYTSISVNSRYAWVDASNYQYGILYKF
jgi:hypothetical protein